MAIEVLAVATTVPHTKTYFMHDNMPIATAGIANGKCVASGSCRSTLELGFTGSRMARSCVAYDPPTLASIERFSPTLPLMSHKRLKRSSKPLEPTRRP